ncbi:FAD-binding oxidoreductase [Pseudomonas carassii]|uniref:D-lactate dehydrogenase (cytochrome) n=1 Tax=Pseudomonas carassii TaxID=3115855 RepID=A0ABU7HG17_9PSED|nr:FAD-linked oxidase C-terminal domain-containing protein [Pseudomonas sp. 137P]MEE1890249.1 FAD-linked oxidase C-terminal domain-containing protein [Pseudomonas sp. 137P]
MTLPAEAFTYAALREAPAALLEALESRFAQRFSTARAVREQHGRDESAYVDAPLPQAVVFARSTVDIVDTVRLLAAHRVPLIAYGAGSSVEGHLLAVQGGISLDLSQMDRILAIHPEDMTATVQPGVTRCQLEEALKGTGLFFPIDPGADASLGGMCATGASGTNAVRYGTMKENVLALEVVTAQGEVIRTGTRAKKSSAGYDLTHLMVGSEGTLGIISEITLRLHPVPESICAAVCSFDSIEQAVNTAIQVIQCGISVARIELIDANTVRMVNTHSKLELPQAPMLLMEFHGSEAGAREQAQAVEVIAVDWGGKAFQWAASVEERRRLWTARHHAYFAAIQSRPGCRAISTDTCVPISRLAECLLESIAEVDAAGLPYFLVGHVGDGNFHFGYLVDPDDRRQWLLAESLNDRLVARAIRLGGTCTGEHGIGLHKQAYLLAEAGEGAVAMMRAIKRTLDPYNILNPGKIFSFD